MIARQGEADKHVVIDGSRGGGAVAFPKEFGNGVACTFMVCNYGVKSAPCKTRAARSRAARECGSLGPWCAA